MKGPILGWDIGGANIKAVRIRAASDEPEVFACAFPLWRERERLPSVLREAAARLGHARAMAVTMTAELADCFATKREGVNFVLDAFSSAFPGVEPWVYGIDGRFRSGSAARLHPLRVAAANWMASATVTARTFPDALFVDVGSTTTDIIPIVAGRVAARGRTDVGRLRTGELVYTGALRTPVCAIVRAAPVRGRRCRVAAELFAIAADVHLWLGRISEADYTCETPDGRSRSLEDAAARIARMVCGDLDMLGSADVTAIAEHVARAQVGQIARAIRQVTRRFGSDRRWTAVLAGQGTFLARVAAEQMGLQTCELAGVFGARAASAAPAAAVAYLLAEIGENDGPRSDVRHVLGEGSRRHAESPLADS
jgi:(4-(4-[2-(gamma-L-glutamylamino)ethyl]phenoxymethyl)furan-2-yl)methanamine synthase